MFNGLLSEAWLSRSYLNYSFNERIKHLLNENWTRSVLKQNDHTTISRT